MRLDEFNGARAGDRPTVIQSRFLGVGLSANPVERELGDS